MVAIMRECVAILLHFRSAEMTRQCIESLASESVSTVVIVDNSEDAGVSLRELNEYMRGIAIGVRVIEPGHNLGFAAGINRGIELIAGAMPEADVLLINSDATLVKGTVDHLRRAVAGDVPSVAAPSIDGPTGLVPARTYYRHFSATISPAGPGVRGHALLGGACLMLHRSLVHAPLFDESFFFYGDDIELGFRLGREGVALVDVPEGRVVHQGSGSSENGSLFYEYHMTRAHLLMVSRLDYGVCGRVGLVAGRILFLGLRALVRSVRFRALRPWRGLFLASIDVWHGRSRSLTPPA
jgi:GT2 family glycosyltransferase